MFTWDQFGLLNGDHRWISKDPGQHIFQATFVPVANNRHCVSRLSCMGCDTAVFEESDGDFSQVDPVGAQCQARLSLSSFSADNLAPSSPFIRIRLGPMGEENIVSAEEVEEAIGEEVFRESGKVNNKGVVLHNAQIEVTRGRFEVCFPASGFLFSIKLKRLLERRDQS